MKTKITDGIRLIQKRRNVMSEEDFELARAIDRLILKRQADAYDRGAMRQYGEPNPYRKGMKP